MAPRSLEPSGTTIPTPAPSPSRSTWPSPRSIEPEEEIDLESPSGGLIATEDAIWATTEAGFVRIDPATNAVVEIIETEEGRGWFAIGFGSIWTTLYDRGVLKRYDMSTGSLVATIDLGEGVLPAGVAVTDDAVWVASHHGGSVLRLDPIDHAVVAEVPIGRLGRSGPNELLAAGGAVWVGVPNLPGVVSIDPASNTAETTVEFTSGAAACGPLSLIDEEIWISSCFDWTTLSVVSIAEERERGTAHLRGYGGQAAEVNGTVWIPVTDSPDGDVLLGIDPESLAVIDVIALPDSAYPAIVAFDSLWVCREEAGVLARFSLADLGG